MTFYEPGISKEESDKRDLKRAKQEENERKKFEEPYTVEKIESGCENCGNGKMWAVVNPDGFSGGTSYGDKEEAEDLAEQLNRAFRLGQAKKRA